MKSSLALALLLTATALSGCVSSDARCPEERRLRGECECSGAMCKPSLGREGGNAGGSQSGGGPSDGGAGSDPGGKP